MDPNHTCDDKFFGMCGKCGRWIAGAIGILLAIFLLAKSFHEFQLIQNEGDGVYPGNEISVHGTGEVTAVPNVASFTYSVIETAKTVPDAQKLATEKSNKTIEYLKSKGIDEKDIKTLGYSVSPKYTYQGGTCVNGLCPVQKEVLTGYEVNQTVLVKVRKPDGAGEILSGIGSLAVSNVSGLAFTIDDEEGLKAEARKKAIADAKAKAKELAKDLGVHLEDIVSFGEDSGGYPVPYYTKDAAMAGNMTSERATPPELPSGENTITSNVTITYKIGD